MPDEWFYVNEGQQAGPVSGEELRGWIANGTIPGSNLVWREGMPEWIEASEAFPDVAAAETAVCAVTGQVRPVAEMLQYGNAFVSPEHKDKFLQELGEGGAAGNISSGLHSYADPRFRAKVTKWLFICGTILEALSTALLFFQSPLDSPDFNFADVAVIFTAPVFVILFITGIVFYCMWKHRVCANAHAFGAPLTFSPGWAVGWYFIPVALLWKPFQAMAEIWKGTFGQALDEPSPGILKGWWTLWLISNIGGNISFRMGLSGDQDLYDASLILDVFLLLVSIGLLLAILKIIDAITREQVARAERGEGNY